MRGSGGMHCGLLSDVCCGHDEDDEWDLCDDLNCGVHGHGYGHMQRDQQT